MSALQDAERYASMSDGDIPGEVGARNAQRAIAFALIAIAEELRAMNERAQLEIERQELQADLEGEREADFYSR